jgi:cytochrome P450
MDRDGCLPEDSSIPGPRGLPLAGNALSFLHDKLGFLSRSAAKYGEVVRLQLGGPTYLLSNPADIRHVLVANADNYEKTPRLIGPRAKRFFGIGVVTLTGAEHVRQRRLLHPAYHDEVMAHFGSCVASEMDGMMKTWPSHGLLDVNREMLGVTQRIITRVLFGDGSPSDNIAFERAIAIRRRYQEYLLENISPISQNWPTIRNRRHARADSEIDSITRNALLERRKRPASDMLGMLAHAAYDDGSGMTDEQICDEVRTIAVGGYETLAEALTWLWYLLAQHPDAMDRVIAEIDSVSPSHDPSASDTARLVYCRMVLSEAMRLYPAAWLLVRVAKGADVLPSGARIPETSRIYVSQWVSHRNPRYFPEPDRFDPERFNAQSIRARPRLAYFPFGAGRRRCIGEDIAWTEGLMIIASIARRFRFTLSPDSAAVPRPSVTLRPRGGLEMIVSARK